jgi:hypothetical protein
MMRDLVMGFFTAVGVRVFDGFLVFVLRLVFFTAIFISFLD